MTPDEQLYDGQPVAHVVAMRERQRLAKKQHDNREAYEASLRRTKFDPWATTRTEWSDEEIAEAERERAADVWAAKRWRV